MAGRKIGSGMKPRTQNTEENEESQELVPDRLEDETGQAKSAIDPFESAVEGDQLLGNVVSIENPKPEDLGEIPGEEPKVAETPGFGPAPEGDFEELQRLLKESEDYTDREFAADAQAAKFLDTPKQIEAQLDASWKIPETLEEREGGPTITLATAEDLKKLLTLPKPDSFPVLLGEQPDGTFKMVVTIREGMIEGIKQQAESDQVVPEEWVSTRLGEYLEQWWFGR